MKYKVSWSKVNNSFISLCWNLFIIYLIFKLTNVLNWHWMWILSPLWIMLFIQIIINIIKEIKK